MSDDEGHSGNLELGGSSNLVHNKEPGKIRGGSKRMEEKEKKPKRHYKKRTPKPTPAPMPAEEGGEGGATTATGTGTPKANRNRVSKRNNESSKKRTRTPSKPPIIEAELLNPSGGPSKILQLDPRKFIPLNRIFPPGVPFPPCAACNDDIYSWDEESRMRRLRNMCPPDDDDDMDTDSDSDTEECTLNDIGEILKEILVEFRKHDPTDKDN